MIARMNPWTIPCTSLPGSFRWKARLSSLPLALVTSLPFAVACGPSDDGDAPPPVVSEIAPVSPTGSVTGFVYDALTGAPLEGVTVVARVPAASAAKQASTDAEGAFVIEGVPASNEVAVHYRAEGYFDAWDTVEVPSSAGNLAQDNGVGFSGPIGLLPEPAADAMAPAVLVRADGVAVAATVTANLEVAWLDDGEARGNLFASTSDDGSGRFTLGGLPDFQRLAAVAPEATLRVVVVPSDPAYTPRVTTLTVAGALSAGAVLVEVATPVDDGEVELVVVSSNVSDLADPGSRFPSVLVPGTPVTVQLSSPVDADSLFATAVNHRGQALATTSTVEGATVTLDIAGVGDGDEVFVYLEALAAGIGEGQGPVPFVTASGFFLTASSGGLVIAGYDDARKNNALRSNADSALVCPADGGAALWLELTEHVGARDEEGDPVASSALLPIRVTSTTAPANHPLNPANGGLIGRVVEQPSGAPASGFSRWVRVPWTPIDSEQPAVATSEFQFKLVFNDASLGATGEEAVVRFPTGAPVETLQQAGVEFAVRPPETGVDDNGCAPGP